MDAKGDGNRDHDCCQRITETCDNKGEGGAKEEEYEKEAESRDPKALASQF